MCRKFLCFNLLKSLLAVISLPLLMAKWCTVPPLSTPSRVRGNRVQLLYNRNEIMQSVLYCAQWGRVLTKCPGGTSCFMGFMPQGGLQICTKHRLTQIFPNTSFMQWEIPKKQNLVKCCMLWHVIPNKCMKYIVLMLTLLTFFHSMTKTKHQHQIHHLHR